MDFSIERDHAFINGEIFSWSKVLLKPEVHFVQEVSDFPNWIVGRGFLLLGTIDIQILPDLFIFFVSHY
jgi:hypothetical protein